MAGPTAVVPLREPLTATQVEALDEWLRSVSSRLEGTLGDWGPFWVSDVGAFGLPADSWPPCAFYVKLEEPEPDEEMTLVATAACLGYRPVQDILLYAGCRGAENHRILGLLALRVAERYSGMIDLGGALAPSVRYWELPPDATEDDHPSQTPEAIRAFVGALPGRVYEIPYPASRGRKLFTHMVDVEFLRAWLQHPEFHMIA
jgi:hypothetical protein